jgi:hypothetical protein
VRAAGARCQAARVHLPLRAVARACAAAAVVGIAVAAVVVLGGRPPLTDVVRVGEAPGGGSATACAPAGDGGGDGGDGEERVSFGQSAPAYRSDLSVCVDGQDLCALGEPVPADAEPVLEVSREAVCGEEPAGWDPAAALLTPQDAAAA